MCVRSILFFWWRGFPLWRSYEVLLIDIRVPVPSLHFSLRPGTPVLPGTQAVSGHVLLRFLSGVCVCVCDKSVSLFRLNVAVGVLYIFHPCLRPDVVPITINKHLIKLLKQRHAVMISLFFFGIERKPTSRDIREKTINKKQIYLP